MLTNFSLKTPVGRSVKKEWRERLRLMGRGEVRNALSRVSAIGEGSVARFRMIDLGIMYGANRHPPVSFVENWLTAGQDSEENSMWRVLTAIVIALLGVISVMYTFAL